MPRHNVSARRQVIKTTPMFFTIQEIEAAINFWRGQSPAFGEELRLCLEVTTLAKPYALMIVQGAQRIPVDVMDEAARVATQGYLKKTHTN